MDRNSTSSDTEAQVSDLTRQAFDALLRQDIGWYEKNYAEDYTGIYPDGSVLNKQQVLASTRAGDIKLESGTLDEQQVRVYGDAAVVNWKFTAKGTYKGQVVSGQYRGMTVYAKKGGQWQTVATQTTAIAQ